jgi:hypothetical protein
VGIRAFVLLGHQQNHEAGKENTEDTVWEKIFLMVLLCICVFVIGAKKSQPKLVLLLLLLNYLQVMGILIKLTYTYVFPHM